MLLKHAPAAAFIGFVSAASICYAQSECVVEIKMIEPIDLAHSSAAAPVEEEVKTQLQVLPYSTFQTVSRDTRTVKLDEKAEFSLRASNGGEHTLMLEPHMSSEKLDLEVHWNGPAGEQLLSTKLRVDNGKHVIFGAEGEVTTLGAKAPPTVFCVNVRCG